MPKSKYEETVEEIYEKIEDLLEEESNDCCKIRMLWWEKKDKIK